MRYLFVIAVVLSAVAGIKRGVVSHFTTES